MTLVENNNHILSVVELVVPCAITLSEASEATELCDETKIVR